MSSSRGPSMSFEHFFFTLLINVKMYHWQTTSYVQHKSTDMLYTQLKLLIDKFIEVYSSDQSRPKGNFNVECRQLTKTEFMSSIRNAIICLRSIEKTKNINQTELLNLRDEILSNLNRMLYLFTFN